MGVKRGMGCVFLKIGGYQEGGGRWKKKWGGWYTFPHYGGEGMQPAKNLLILPIWKKIFPPTWKNFPVSRLPSPVLPNTKFLFSQACKPKLLNQYRHIEKQHWDWTIIKGAWDKVPTVREMCKLGDIACFGKFSKTCEEKTLFRLRNTWSNICSFFWTFLATLSN